MSSTNIGLLLESNRCIHIGKALLLSSNIVQNSPVPKQKRQITVPCQVDGCLRLLVTYITSLPSLVGGCLFDEPYSTCGYSQADDDDFNWEQVNTLTKPTSDPWMPSGLPLLSSVLSEIGLGGSRVFILIEHCHWMLVEWKLMSVSECCSWLVNWGGWCKLEDWLQELNLVSLS